MPRNVQALAVTSFLRDVASESLVHLLPLYLGNVLAARTATIGLIEGLAEATAGVSKAYSGWLSDKLRRRKGLTVLGYSMAGLAVPLLLVARTSAVVGVARFLDRLGKGIRTAPRDALIADSVSSGKRGLWFGVHRAADSAGAFVGLLTAMLFIWRYQGTGRLLTGDAFHAVVMWASVPALLAVVAVVFGVREISRPVSAEPAGVGTWATDARFRRFILVMTLFALGNSSDSFLILRAQSVGASVLEALGMIAGLNIVYAAAAGPAGSVSDRLDRRSVITAGWLLYAAIYVGFAASSAPWHLWLLYAGYGVYYAATEGVAKALVADLVPADRRGAAYGLYNASVGLAALPASVLAGVLWQGIGPWQGLGPAAPFLAGGLLALAASALLWRWAR